MSNQEKVMVTIETTVQTTLPKAWEAWTVPHHITQWNWAIDTWHCPVATNDLTVGGRTTSRMEAKDGSMGFEFGGTYTAVDTLQHLAFTMDDGRTVSVDFAEVDGGVHITETFEAETQNSVEMQQQGWQMILNNYKTYAETI